MTLMAAYDATMPPRPDMRPVGGMSAANQGYNIATRPDQTGILTDAAASLVATPVYRQTVYNYGTWTAEEDKTLLDARARGIHWPDLQQTYFPNKTSNACRKRYERLVERQGIYDVDARKLEQVSREYMNMRKQIWSGLAAKVGEKWEVVEAQACFAPSSLSLPPFCFSFHAASVSSPPTPPTIIPSTYSSFIVFLTASPFLVSIL
jgi:hypothetical protein